MEYTRTPRASPRANSIPRPSAVLRTASASAVLSFLIMVALALFLELAFESSVCVTDVSGSKVSPWVRIPFDRPGDGHFLVPLYFFKTTFLDQVVMPVLFAFMIITASAIFVQNLELEHFFF